MTAVRESAVVSCLASALPEPRTSDDVRARFVAAGAVQTLIYTQLSETLSMGVADDRNLHGRNSS